MKNLLSLALAAALATPSVWAFAPFYEKAGEIKMYDPLSKTLGVNEDGILRYSFADVAKTAGHTCTATAGAWLMLKSGLKALYGGQIPERGGLKITVGGEQNDGVSGVIANVAELITGATKEQGFKGIFGKFNRMNLLDFDGNKFTMKLERLDTGAAVRAVYAPKNAMANWAHGARLKQLQSAMAQGSASEAEQAEFAQLWQEKVRILLENEAKVISIERLK